MFLLVYVNGLINLLFWRLDLHVGGTAPSFYTAWRTYGWLGYHYKHRYNPRHICRCNKFFFRRSAKIAT